MGWGQRRLGCQSNWGKARLLRAIAAHCGLDSLVAREDSRTLSSLGLQLVREQSDAGHRHVQESPNCL